MWLAQFRPSGSVVRGSGEGKPGGRGGREGVVLDSMLLGSKDGSKDEVNLNFPADCFLCSVF